jgi:hypothetical protein
MSGSPVASVTLLADPGNLPLPQTCYHLRLLFPHFHCPKPVHEFVLGREEPPPPPLMIADNKIFSPAKRQCNEMPYYFSCIMAVLFREQSVYSDSNEIITQWSLPKCLINFSISYGRTMTSQCSQ